MINRKKILKALKIIQTAPEYLYRAGRRSLHLPNPPRLYYVTPGAGWATDWVGHYITQSIREQFTLPAQITNSPHLLMDHLLHYGEVGAFNSSIGSRRNSRNLLIATIFHGCINTEFPNLSENTSRFVDHSVVLKKVVTSCRIMEDRLLHWGVVKDKVVCIPLGVDLEIFYPTQPAEKAEIRRKMGIPSDAICIGSFQKDGVGWGDGFVPKLIKGPDIFLDVIAKLNKKHKLFVLLTGPSRGYMKTGLDKLGVPYLHTILNDYLKIVDYYHCLDLYLVTSREEGGPKAILEALATGIPIVSTRVGLAPDVIRHRENGMLANIDDVAKIAEHAAYIIENPAFRARIISQGLLDIEQYSWKKIAARYYNELYLPVLANAGR